MHRTWQLQDAKARFSEVIRACHEEGPQDITLRGDLTAVVLSQTDYARMAAPKPSFVEWLRASPFVGLDIDIERDPSPAREIDL